MMVAGILDEIERKVFIRRYLRKDPNGAKGEQAARLWGNQLSIKRKCQFKGLKQLSSWESL